MQHDAEKFERYFSHLRQISRVGLLYKRLFAAPVLYWYARRFGPRVMEVGFGFAAGLIGAFPRRVWGLEINPLAVDYCSARGLRVKAIAEDGTFPEVDGAFDVCLLDNVLEHIEAPFRTLDECHRITRPRGGLIIIVPGERGYASDDDHKKFYGVAELQALDPRWELQKLFSLPVGFISPALSRRLKQYCLVGVYAKRAA
ncbi:MAG: class I SAM-dependent methyltransferase [Burkholderiales bacterium]|nr:class I SAM-dependent methyltransferase [Burkholderiales bacterium]